MARYTAFFPRTTTDSAVQDDGIAIKNEQQSKEGSDDIRFMTYHHNEKMPVLVYVY